MSAAPMNALWQSSMRDRLAWRVVIVTLRSRQIATKEKEGR